MSWYDDYTEADEVADMAASVERRECGACGGPLALLGYLGSLVWLKCRNCGLEWSHSLNPACVGCGSPTSDVRMDGARYCEQCGWLTPAGATAPEVRS